MDDTNADNNTAAEDGAALLDEALALMERYVVLPSEHASVAVVLWIAVTHALPAFDHAPRLVINSPEKRCGKSRLLDVVGGMCHWPILSVSASAPAIFRMIEKSAEHPPTLLIDEADTVFGSKRAAEQNEDLRGLLNAGHQRGRTMLRCHGPNLEPRQFATFAMAALAGIGNMPDTIADRAVNITMRRRKPDEHAAPFRSKRDAPALTHLRKRLAAWTRQSIDKLTDADPAMPVEDRAADTWYPLVAIADQAGGNWPQRARAACAALTGEAASADEEASNGVRLLKDIKTVFEQHDMIFLGSTELVGRLRKLPESPWDDWELTTRKFAKMLKPYKIESDRDSTGSLRGYKLADFADAFARYLAGDSRSDPSEVSDPSEIMPEQEEPSDASRTSDTSIRQTESKRQNIAAVKSINLTHLTLLTDTPAEDGQTTCADCGRRLTGKTRLCVSCALEKAKAQEASDSDEPSPGTTESQREAS